MNRHVLETVLVTSLIVFGIEPLLNIQAYAGQADLHAVTAAKAAAGEGARAHLGMSSVPRPYPHGPFTSFDAPGSAQGTFPTSINAEGASAGYFLDKSSIAHGFLRTSDGAITTFDAPGAVNGTYPGSINLEGLIIGYFYDANFVFHGFVRTRSGTISTFDAPSAVNGTSPASINLAGVITGSYLDTNSIAHGFLRVGNGSFINFDPVGSTYTIPSFINPLGVITGLYDDINNVSHGFLRAPSPFGTITSFDVPGSANGYGTFPYTLNPEGVVTGNYFQPISGNPFGGNFRGFVRFPDGSFATFDAASYSPCCIFTYATAIAPSGVIAGYFNDGYNLNHGFLRTSAGGITTFDAPGAGTGSYQGTVVSGITPGGVVVGYYTPNNAITHGFLYYPPSSDLAANK